MQVRLEEGQDIDSALKALRTLVQEEHGRPWYKSRYGYHETRSELRRKRKKMDRLRGKGKALYRDPINRESSLKSKRLWGKGKYSACNGHWPAKDRASSPCNNKVIYEDLFVRTGNPTSVSNGYPPWVLWRSGIPFACLKPDRANFRASRERIVEKAES